MAQGITKHVTGWHVWMFVLFLLFVEAGALAHELEHQHQNLGSPCALCQFSDHLGKTPVSAPFVFVAPGSFSAYLPVSQPAIRFQPVPFFSARAPPLLSEI
jgi:hypothetical protein